MFWLVSKKNYVDLTWIAKKVHGLQVNLVLVAVFTAEKSRVGGVPPGYGAYGDEVGANGGDSSDSSEPVNVGRRRKKPRVVR